MQHCLQRATACCSLVGFQPIFERLFGFIMRLLYLALWALRPLGQGRQRLGNARKK